MAGLNENQQRAFRAAFRRIDELLIQIENAVTGEPSPFAGISSDLAPADRRAIIDRVAHVRHQMVDALNRLGVSPPTPEAAASWVIETAATFAELAIEEVTPSRLRKYGRLDPATIQAIDHVEQELRGAIRTLPLRRKSGGKSGS